MDYGVVRESVRARVRSSNEKVLSALVKQLRSPVGVTPFLGAGISAPLAYRQWADVLKGMIAEQLGGAARVAADEALAKEDYLRAAGLVAAALGREDFQSAIAEEFSDDRLAQADLATGAFGFLPALTSGPVITTNFDRVIEHVFDRAGRRFEDAIFGTNPLEVTRIFQQNRRALWKIHGDRSDNRSLVFTDEEYQRHYVELPGLLTIALLNRPALFIGSSLIHDRTTEVLAAIRERHPAVRHYAFDQIPETDEKFDERVTQLQKMGIRPIWYPTGEHKEIASFLAGACHAVSAVPLERVRIAAPVGVPAPAADQGASNLLHELKAEAAQAATPGPEAPQQTPPYGSLVHELAYGHLMFFLGAGACLGRLPLSGHFYRELLEEFDDRSNHSYGAGMEPTRVTQLFADRYGREAFYAKVREQLARKAAEPTAIHWFIATLDERLRAKGYQPAQQWVLTTNYDDWMETALRMAGRPFHLFTYRVDGPYAGSFIYQAPDGNVHVVDRPANFHHIADDGCLVLVKLHGGVHATIDLPVSYAFMYRDFVELAGRIPDVVPHAILSQLARKSLLFLGSGLRDDSIESLIRSRRKSITNSHRLSWAVQRQPPHDAVVYWRQLGVDILDVPLERFILELHRRL